jgi:hypothetical protein
VTTHRRAGRHLPGAGLSRRDPRRTRQCIYQGESRRGAWPAAARFPWGESLARPSGEDRSTVSEIATVA